MSPSPTQPADNGQQAGNTQPAANPQRPDSAQRPGNAQPEVTSQASDLEAWIGASADVVLVVSDGDTAQALGSGDVPVLATPRVVALVEAATVRATARRIANGATTVGTRVDLRHTAPTPIGATVVAEARLTEVSGRSLRFEVSVRQGSTTVATGTVDRVLLDRRRFLAKATEPTKATESAKPTETT